MLFTVGKIETETEKKILLSIRIFHASTSSKIMKLKVNTQIVYFKTYLVKFLKTLPTTFIVFRRQTFTIWAERMSLNTSGMPTISKPNFVSILACQRRYTEIVKIWLDFWQIHNLCISKHKGFRELPFPNIIGTYCVILCSSLLA